MPTPPATVDEFKARFVRDFFYDETPDAVMDADITNALNDASLVFNPGLWGDALELKTAFLFISAHFLVLNIQAAGGLAGNNLGLGVESAGGGSVQSKTVGPVTINYAIAPAISENAILNQFMRTDYGQKYLQLLTPRLVGNVAVVGGFDDTGAPDGQ